MCNCAKSNHLALNKTKKNLCVDNIKKKKTKVINVNETNNNSNTLSVPKGYLVWSPKCRMLSLDALAPDVMKLFNKENFEPCSKKHPLTSIEQNFDDDIAKFVFYRGMKSKYLNADQNQLDCCYQEITRGGSNKTADDKFK